MKKLKLLFLAANPGNTARLRLDEEFRQIQSKIQASKFGSRLDLACRWALRPEDIQQALMQEEPHIVHFSGHGKADDEIILTDNNGNKQPVAKDALVNVFITLKDNIHAVVLNACYSQPQAETLAQVVDFAIGMNTAIGDKAAIEFASSFYQALGYNRTMQEAFDIGINALQLARIPEDNTPRLHHANGMHPANVKLLEKVLGNQRSSGRDSLSPQTKEALNSLSKLTTLIRDESRKFMREYEKNYFTRIRQGEDPETIKHNLSSASYERIDREADCSRLILDVQIGLEGRNPTEWREFFFDQQKRYAQFQQSVHDAVQA